ncbi:MAG: winged helix-turn-helix domain-containing protein, partial [Acidobacteriota bacterium]
MRLRFAQFVLDLRLGRVEGPGGEVHLRPRTFHLLELLVREAPRVVSGEELLNRVWGTEHLSENSLRQAISELRQALGDSASRPTIIETVHRRGYRLIAEVETPALPDEGSTEVVEPPQPDPAPLSRVPGGRLGMVVLLLVALWVLPHPRPVSSGPGVKPAIAMLDLETFGADDSEVSWVPAALRELLRFELSVSGAARLIDETDIDWALERHGIGDRSALSPAEARMLG